MTFKELRKNKKMPARKLAKIVGLSDMAIYNYDKGIRRPRYSTLSKLAKALKVTEQEVLDCFK